MRNPIQHLLQFIVEPNPRGKGRIFFFLWAGLLLMGGALFWVYFLDWGNPASFQFHDWTEITLPRLTFVQNSLREGSLPLHIASAESLHGLTNRFLSFPDLLLSPQIVLLLWLDVIPFVVVNLMLSFLAGGIGLVWLARRLKLSILAFSLLFLLFNFNGHILAHISVGHYTWTAFFLFPWLIGFALRLLDEQRVGWRWVAGVAGLLFVMDLQGGYHELIWSLFFLDLLILIVPRHAWRILQAAVLAVLLSAVRIAPLFLNLGKFENSFDSGYAGMLEIWKGLTVRYLPGSQLLGLDMQTHYGTWEYTLYIGLLGALFLFVFGVGMAITNRKRPGSYALLLVPALLLAMFSLDGVYNLTRMLLPLPLITGERISTRFAALAVLLLLTLAVTEFQRMLDQRPPAPAWFLGGMGLIAASAHDLFQNARFQQLGVAVQSFDAGVFLPESAALVKMADPVYTNTLWAGLAVTLLSAGFLIYVCVRERRRQSRSMA